MRMRTQHTRSSWQIPFHLPAAFKPCSHGGPKVSPVEVSKQARLAGVLYVLMGIPGAFFLQYVPRQLIVRGDPAATSAQLLGQEPLFRLGLAAELFSTIVFIFTALALYRLFKSVDRDR